MLRPPLISFVLPLVLTLQGCATAGLSSRAKGNLAQFISDEDYPDSAIRAGSQGVVAFAFEVAADGHVTDCTIEKTSGDVALDGTTCRIVMTRVHLTPARDRRGRPTTDRLHARIRWVLPQAEEEDSYQAPSPPS